MKIVKWLGVLAFLGGLALSGFHAIGRLMERPEGFYSESIAEFAGGGGLEWIEALPFGFLRNGMDFIVQVPLYMVLIGAGLLLLIIHGLFAKA
ncbi:MAG: hypothetical protein ACLFMN_05825 [Desulfobacterales bacterium]